MVISPAVASQSAYSTTSSAVPAATVPRLKGLDSIRYVCALLVVLFHSQLFLQNGQNHSILFRMAVKVYGAGLGGPAAVIVFFVVSGLCIHYPHCFSRKVNYPIYYLRRYIRIGVPMAVAIAIIYAPSHSLRSVSLDSINKSVLWSLVAEIVYYTLYPVLMATKKLLGWKVLLGASFVCAYALVFSHPAIAHQGFYQLFGSKLNWILGLPCWLLGCLLAENISQSSVKKEQAPITSRHIWQWRTAVWLCSCVTILLQFHQNGRFHLGYSTTLDIFAVLAFFWLRQEIFYYRTHTPLRWLEAAGASSYSLYLVHPIIIGWIGSHLTSMNGSFIKFYLCVFVSIAASVLFYYLVERPSHLLARRFRETKKRVQLPVSEAYTS